MRTHQLLISIVLAGCGGSSSPGTPNADAPPLVDAGPVVLPSWMLEDVQPVSPLAGQTYGLQTFSNKIVVVTLLEGF